jgi:hypothetical protein
VPEVITPDQERRIKVACSLIKRARKQDERTAAMAMLEMVLDEIVNDGKVH